MSREAMQQALEALELARDYAEGERLENERRYRGHEHLAPDDAYAVGQIDNAITTLRAALAHQEPDLRNANPIGLTPPQKALQLAQFRADALAQQEAIERHRAIEAALKERNT